MSTTVLLNRGGGAAAADERIAERVGQALERAGIVHEIEEVDGGEVERRCQAIAERGDALVIVAGGDGTVSAAAAALAASATALGILPLGTLNHFARDTGIPNDLDQAAELIARGSRRTVDVAQMNGRTFINNSAIGLYPLMVLDRDLQRQRLGRSKRLAMLIASLRTLARFNHQRLTLTVNDEQERIDTPLLFVGNNDYRIALRGGAGRRDSLDDGKLCVLVMRKKTRRGLIAASIRALFDRAREDDMERIEGVERLRVGSRRSQLPVSLDGEVVSAAPPLDYRIRKRALVIVAP